MPIPDYAPALGRVPSGLFVLTCRSGDVDTGLLTSWVQQCSFEPPLLSVAIRRGRDIATMLSEGAVFALNILAEGQKELLGHFGKGLELEQVPRAQERIERTPGRAAVLREALGVLHCQVATRLDAGDHHLLLARVTAGVLHSEDRPMVHIRKNGLNY
jgi:flavin reductase (DIM6/NTAB) family NADH-FMN oxidoreductase RutF